MYRFEHNGYVIERYRTPSRRKVQAELAEANHVEALWFAQFQKAMARSTALYAERAHLYPDLDVIPERAGE